MWSFPPSRGPTAEAKTLPWIIHVDEQMEKCYETSSNNQRENSLSEAHRSWWGGSRDYVTPYQSVLPDRRRKEGLIQKLQAENTYARASNQAHSLHPTTKREELLKFGNNHCRSKYQAFYTKDIEVMNQSTIPTKQNYANFLASVCAWITYMLVFLAFWISQANE